MKYFIEISYKGTAYHGWQIQKNALSVQEVINNCLTKILRTDIVVYGSGRTDTGVHCLQQFAHFETIEQLDIHYLLKRCNAFLPSDIAIKQILPVIPDAHARFSALSRKYIYKISPYKNPFLIDFAYQLFHPLNLERMQEAADLLIKWEDYTAFSKTNSDVEHHLCRIAKAYWQEEHELICFHIIANRFLRGMVRLLTGALLQVGMDKISVNQFKSLLILKQRNTQRFAVPPQGLYLSEVKYPEDIFL
ncbi:MAG: tRNA pseudouridine(38-40) synthase TruA [Bacteroidota bacterium]